MAAIDDLKNLLAEDVRQLDQLSELLKQEKALLGDSDIRSLQTVTEQKNAALMDIRERAKQKIHLLVAMGYSPDQGEPSRFILGAGLKDTYALWQQASERLKTCRQLNEGNGKVVQHLQKRLARLTDVFRGTSGQQKLYGSKGEQTGMNNRSILASA